MGSVGTPVVRRIVQVAQGPDSAETLLASVGLSTDLEPTGWHGQSVDEDAYYDLIERVTADGDDGLPFRYAEALHPDDLGALGLALKTAPTVEGALRRLVRYVLVLSDTLEYELVDRDGRRLLVLAGRPHHRRGAAIANECALAAVVSVLRQIVGTALAPDEVMFSHGGHSDGGAHREFFGCTVSFQAPLDAIDLGGDVLSCPTLLGDEGLSTYLLAQLDDLTAQVSQRSLVASVRGAIADQLPEGQPSKSQVARRLGMSERTLHRRLAEVGESFQDLATRTRHEAAESLLRSGDQSLAEVAFLTGFSDQTAFTRAFKRWSGTTPAAFRGDAGRHR
jgi:AraC-like DNA-binding protein